MSNREALQVSVGRAIETEALPLYRIPFHRFPRARDESGRYRLLANPFFGVMRGKPLEYGVYIQRVREGLCSPRTIHGPIHAARVTLWAGLLSILFERFGLGVIDDIFALQMAAAFHDAGRQDEGVDRWEPESKRTFMRWFVRIYPDVVNVSSCPASMTHSSEMAILRDADILDILRVLPSLDAFDARRLSFWRDSRIPTEVQHNLIREVYVVIQLTEQPELKRELEESGSLYFRLMHLIVQVHRQVVPLALLSDLLNELAGQT